MAGTAEVLQEYLVSLGFQTDAISLKKFEDGLSATGKKVLGVGVAVAGVVASVEAASAAFAYSMRKIYFESELSNTTVKNLKAMEFAGKQVGISGDSMASSIHGMAQAMRLDPGLQSLVQSFGVRVTGRDTSDVMWDYVKALKAMPEWIGVKYAAMFGMDPDTYHQMITHYDELTMRKQQLIDMYKSSGVDPEAAKKTMLDYATSMDELESRLSILGQTLLMKFAPVFSVISQGLNNLIGMMQTDLNPNNPQAQKNEAEELARLWANTGNPILAHAPQERKGRSASGKVTDQNAPVQEAPREAGSPVVHRNERNNNPGNIRYGPGPFAKNHGAIGKDSDGFAIFPDMATGFKAATDLLEVYGKQNINTVSSVIGKWAPPGENNTAAYIASISRQMGVGANTKLDMNDPKIRQQLGRHIANYEGMMPNTVDKLGDTRLGTAGGSNASVSQVTHISVTGSNAEAIGKSVAQQQTRVNADMLRNFKGAVG